jgi:pimeloyl-ACP methyl ester carboxylesterase
VSAGGEAAAFVEVRGFSLAYEAHGEGHPVVLVHGTGTDRRLWRETVAALGDGVRAVAYDRRGYGESGAPEAYRGTTIEEQTEDLARLLAALEDAPVVVCGHDVGALVALDLARRHAGLVRALVLVEPPLLWLSPRGAQAQAELREAMEAGARTGGPRGAVEAFLTETAGPDAARSLGPERLEAAVDAARPLAADLAAAPRWSTERRALRALAPPAVVLTGVSSRPAVRESAAALADLLPAASLRDSGGGHLVPVDDPGAVAAALAEVGAGPPGPGPAGEAGR